VWCVFESRGFSLLLFTSATGHYFLGGLPVKSIVKGGEADVDGRICVNDSLLKVDGQSLSGLAIEEVLRTCVWLGGESAGGTLSRR